MSTSWTVLLSLGTSTVGVVVAVVVSRREPPPRWGPGVAVRRQLERYATTAGRASRSEFWWPSLVLGLLTALVQVVGLLTGHRPLVAVTLLQAAFLLPGSAAFVRRLHDTGRSGWWYLVGLTGVGIIPLLVWATRRSEPSANRFGPVPGTPEVDVERLGEPRPWTMTGPPRRPWVWGSLTLLGLLGYVVGQVDLDVRRGHPALAGTGLLLVGYLLMAGGLLGLRGAPLFPPRGSSA